MSTNTSPPGEDDGVRVGGRLADYRRRYLRQPYLLVALAAYVVLALFGVYASWRFWSSFGIDYLRYAGIGDYLLAPLNFLRLLIDPGFVVVWLSFTLILALLAGCGGYLLKRLRSVWPGPRQAPKADALPLVERWPDHENLRSYLRALAARPLWAAPVLAIAALLAINVEATAEKRDLRNFARLVQHDYANDRYHKVGSGYGRYELVSLPGPTGGRERLARLRSTDRFALYYDVLADRPLVLADAVAKGEVAEAGQADQTLRAGAVALPPPAHAPAPGGASDRPLPIAQASAATAAPPGSGQNAPIASPAEAAAGPSPDLGLAIDAAAAEDSTAQPVPAARPAAAAADAAEHAKPSAAGEPTPARPEYEALESHLRGSHGSLDGLKSYMQHLENNVVEIHKFINDLDGSLKQIDEAVSRLADLQAAVAQPTYADCPEMTAAARPLEFGADDASLSLEAVGWLFQARRQLTAPRSPDRQEWLVIEGHAAGTDGSTAAPPLAIRRAEAVRDFLRSELGVPPEAVKLVGRSAAGPDEDRVSLYDCLGRSAATAPAPEAIELGLVNSAAARETEPSGAVRPAAWTVGDAGNGLPGLLADLDPQSSARGLLVTVPGDRLFDTDSFRIRTSAYGVLGRIGEALNRAPEHSALIVGHSDAIGDAAYNLSLSQRRARAVRDFLVDRFAIDADRLAVEGRGENDPIATNDTPAGRLANRRIEVLLRD